MIKTQTTTLTYSACEVVKSKYDGVFRAWIKMSYVDLGWTPRKVADVHWRNPEIWVCVATDKDENKACQRAKKYIKA